MRELTKKLPFSFHLKRSIFTETSHEDNHVLPFAQAFASLLCTHARISLSWMVVLLLGQGGKRQLSGTPDLKKGERAEQLQYAYNTN
jgi:hypothetical protein